MQLNGKESRAITMTASVIVALLMIGCFSTVWIYYYNKLVFNTLINMGCFACILAWFILYLKFGQIYRAFKIAASSIVDITFSQFLSFAFADLVIYIAGCLAAKRYLNIVPGVITVVIQALLSAFWAYLAKDYFLKNVEPRKCVLLYDADLDDVAKMLGREFSSKLEKAYGHLFDVVERHPVSDEMGDTYIKIDEYPVVFVYDMPLVKRSQIINYCIRVGKRMYVTPTVEDVVARGYDVKHFIDTPLFVYNGAYKASQTYFGKRALDIIFSLMIMVIALPIILVTAIAIKLEDGGDVFFRQARYTQGGKVFNILKFRSMIMDAEKDGKPRPCVAGDSRITKVGKFIRATRIDELPQIFNILKGDLTWVGPRPERVEHVDLYSKELPEFQYRLRVKGGLTGYAQIYGKYNTSARDKLLLDLLYIEQQSFLLDVKIVLITIKIMFTPESTEGFDDNKSKAINKAANS